MPGSSSKSSSKILVRGKDIHSKGLEYLRKKYNDLEKKYKTGGLLSDLRGTKKAELDKVQDLIKATIITELEKKTKARIEEYNSFPLRRSVLSIDRARIIDKCYGTVENNSCYSSDQNVDYAKKVMRAKQMEMDKTRQLGYDCCFKQATKAYTSSSGKKIRKGAFEFKDFVRNKSSLPPGFTPLKPGDILYYPCAAGLGMIGAEHASVYIGGGACVHLWEDQGYARIICTSLYLASTWKCELLIWDPDKSDDFLPRIEIINAAVEMLSKQELHGQYNMSSNNCHQWVLDMATGRGLSKSHGWEGTAPCWMPITNHVEKSKLLAIDRIQEFQQRLTNKRKKRRKKRKKKNPVQNATGSNKTSALYTQWVV